MTDREELQEQRSREHRQAVAKLAGQLEVTPERLVRCLIKTGLLPMEGIRK
jgi:hypothetical protein